MSVKDNLIVFFCIVELCFCFVTIGNLVLFLSSFSPLNLPPDKESNDDSWISDLVTDVLLMSLFALQHSMQASQRMKQKMLSWGLSVYDRLFYNLASCIVLQLLMHKWRPLLHHTLWAVPVSEGGALWYVFATFHAMSWLFIYSSCYVMDIRELMGVSQIYHHFQGWPEPLSLKSEGLRRLYSHLRHPCFTSFAILFLVHPLMQLDRMLLAIGSLYYIIFFSRVDGEDYFYQRCMLQRKIRDLNCSAVQG